MINHIFNCQPIINRSTWTINVEINSNNCLGTTSFTVQNDPCKFIPRGISPNNDGINDLFRPSLLGLKEVSMNIYDNWGNLVYEISSDTASLPVDWGWNGIEKVNSEPVNGTYRYYIMAKTINDTIIEKEGQFMLIK